MDDDTTLDITRLTALATLGSVGIASAGAGLGTSAFFSDSESFANNQLTAGTLDMTVGWTETYSDWSADEGVDVSVRMYDGSEQIGNATGLQEGETGLPADDAWLIAGSVAGFTTSTSTAAPSRRPRWGRCTTRDDLVPARRLRMI